MSRDYERDVLHKLFARRVLGEHHIRLETLIRCGWKPHERGLVKKAVKKLLKKGLIVWAKKSKKSLALNKKRIKKITSQCTKG